MEDKKRDAILKRIEQGGKIEYLYTIDEFQWWLQWIDNLRTEYKNKILNGNLLTNLREEDHAKGSYSALTKIVEAGEKFAEGAKIGRKQLEKYDKEVKE